MAEEKIVQDATNFLFFVQGKYLNSFLFICNDTHMEQPRALNFLIIIFLHVPENH